jgi:hypothetical protein
MDTFLYSTELIASHEDKENKNKADIKQSSAIWIHYMENFPTTFLKKPKFE